MLQANPPSIFSHTISSEQPSARRNTLRQHEHRRGFAALSEQPDAGGEPSRKPDFSRFQCGAAPLPPRIQLPGVPAHAEPWCQIMAERQLCIGKQLHPSSWQETCSMRFVLTVRHDWHGAGTSPAARKQTPLKAMQSGTLTPRSVPEPSRSSAQDTSGSFLNIVRSKARKLSPSGGTPTRSDVYRRLQVGFVGHEKRRALTCVN